VVLKPSPSTLGVLIWVLIYAGLLVFAVGLAWREVHGLMAGTVSIAGLVIAAVGVGLIGYRARLMRSAAPPAADAPPASTPHR
jgi:hypothetical protein